MDLDRRNISALFAALAVVTAASSMSGCERGEMSVPPSSAKVSDKMPVHFKLGDGTLMRVTQVGWRVHFYKTADGYGEYGTEGHIVGFGGGADWSEGHIYTELNYLETLALVDNDWSVIYDAVAAQEEKYSNSVESKFVRMTLEDLVTERNPDFPLQGVEPLWYESQEAYDRAQASPEVPEPMPSLPGLDDTYSYEEQSVYIRLPDWNLLRVSGHYSSKEGKSNVSFAVTSSGYGVAGAKATSIWGGGGAEWATSMAYSDITPLEAIAICDGNWEKIYGEVVRQSRIIIQSVEPEKVKHILLNPDLSVEAPGVKTSETRTPMTPMQIIMHPRGVPVPDPDG